MFNFTQVRLLELQQISFTLCETTQSHFWGYACASRANERIVMILKGGDTRFIQTRVLCRFEMLVKPTLPYFKGVNLYSSILFLYSFSDI